MFKLCICIRAHEWMHIKYLHIIYSKCVPFIPESLSENEVELGRGGDLKWQWSKLKKQKNDKNAGRTNKFSNGLSINLFVVELLLIRSVSLFFLLSRNSISHKIKRVANKRETRAHLNYQVLRLSFSKMTKFFPVQHDLKCRLLFSACNFFRVHTKMYALCVRVLRHRHRYIVIK